MKGAIIQIRLLLAEWFLSLSFSLMPEGTPEKTVMAYFLVKYPGEVAIWSRKMLEKRP